MYEDVADLAQTHRDVEDVNFEVRSVTGVGVRIEPLLDRSVHARVQPYVDWGGSGAN